MLTMLENCDFFICFLCCSSYSAKLRLSSNCLDDLSGSEVEISNEEEIKVETHDQYQTQDNHDIKHEVRFMFNWLKYTSHNS